MGDTRGKFAKVGVDVTRRIDIDAADDWDQLSVACLSMRAGGIDGLSDEVEHGSSRISDAR
jgi:hypothetical protein